jgi:hypothetical protein
MVSGIDWLQKWEYEEPWEGVDRVGEDGGFVVMKESIPANSCASSCDDYCHHRRPWTMQKESNNET